MARQNAVNSSRNRKNGTSHLDPKASPKTTMASTGSRKRKVRSKDAADFDLIQHPPKTRRRCRLGSEHRYAKKPKTQSAQPPAPSRVLNEAPRQVLTVLVFGAGSCGELGLGPTVDEADCPLVNQFLDPDHADGFPVVQLDCGGMHTIALTRDNKVVTWGVNDQGALGRNTHWDGRFRDMDADSSDDGSTSLNPLESTPTQVPSDYFPPGTIFTQVAAGDSCSLALTDTGLVYGWGAFLDHNGDPKFGFGDDGRFVERQHKPLLIPGLKDITQITCGANHALALDVSGNIWAWGAGEQNQLGRRLLPSRPLQNFIPQRVGVCRKDAKYIASGQYHSFADDGKDNVWAWGLNSYGQAGYAKDAGSDFAYLPYPMKIRGLCGKGVSVLSGGTHHSAAVTADGQCFVWGRIDGGQLGVKFSNEQLADQSLVRRDERNKPRICLRPAPVQHMGETTYVGCGSEHTIFITAEGNAYSSGFGTMGQLGYPSDEVKVAQLINEEALTSRMITWTGAGGQFSVVAAPA